MTHPYRERPSGEHRFETPAARLEAASVAFGFCCAIAGEALAGPACALLVSVVGVLLILRSPRR